LGGLGTPDGGEGEKRRKKKAGDSTFYMLFNGWNDPALILNMEKRGVGSHLVININILVDPP
jgi:hypothetical protein